MTTCAEIQPRLSDYVDGQLGVGELAAVHEHLRSCADCSGVVSDLEQLLAAARTSGAVEPPAHVWPQITDRIRRGDVLPQAASPALAPPRPSTRRRRPWLALAGLILAAALIGWLWRGGPGPAAATDPAGLPPRDGLTTAALAQARSQTARALTTWITAAQADGTDRLLAEAVQASAVAFDTALDEARAALARSPDNRAARDSLTLLAELAGRPVITGEWTAVTTGPARRDRRETRVMALGPAGRLDLETHVGDITVAAGSGGETRVELILHAEGVTEAEAGAALDTFSIDLETLGDRASLTARPHPRVSVSFVVTAPAGTRLRARTTRGTIRVAGIAGGVDAATTSGDIDITGASQVSAARMLVGHLRLRDIRSPLGLTLEALAGSISLEGVQTPILDVETLTADTTLADVDAGRVRARSLTGRIDYTGTLERQGEYAFRSHAGAVRLAVGGAAGFVVQGRSVSGEVTVDTGGRTPGVESRHTDGRAVVGDGSAQVTATTFSGSVQVGRR